MNLPIKPVCKTGKIRKDGTASIAIQYCFTSEKRGLLDSGLGIPPKYWNRRRECISEKLPESYGIVSELNHRLSQELRKAEDLISLALKRGENPLDFFKLYYKPDQSLDYIINELDTADKSKTLTDIFLNKEIYFQIDDYIKMKARKVSAGMPRIYRNMKDHLLAFEQFRKKPITFECLDINFYEEFVNFLTYDYVLARRKKRIVGLKTNTVGKTIKQFKTFLKDRIKKKIIDAFDMDDWIVLEVEVDAVYVSVEEIKSIINTDIAKYPHLQDYKNDMMLGC